MDHINKIVVSEMSVSNMIPMVIRLVSLLLILKETGPKTAGLTQSKNFFFDLIPFSYFALTSHVYPYWRQIIFKVKTNLPDCLSNSGLKLFSSCLDWRLLMSTYTKVIRI